MASAGQKVLESRRKQEDLARAMQHSLNDANKALQKANFEIQTTKKLESRGKQEKFRNQLLQQEYDLLKRRQTLADLYNYEREAWQEEVLLKVESVEDRKQRIMERAYELRDTREKAKQEFVKKCYDDQWRDACDDARTLDSKAMDMYVGADRVAQVQAKLRANQKLSDQENVWMGEYDKHSAKLEAAEKAKADYRAKAAKDLQEGLRRQMEDNNKRLDENISRTLREATEEINECQAAITAEEELQRKLKEDAFRAGREVLLFNDQYKSVRQDEEKLEKKQDAQLLAYALRKEKERIAEENLLKESQKQAAQQYRKYLEEMMIKDAFDNSGLDEVRKAEENRIWKARDDVLQAREDARKYLMKLVDEGRQDQISRKYQQLQQEKEDEKIYSRKFLVDAAEGVAKEKADALRRRQAGEDNNKVLMDQISRRRQQIELEKQEEYLANKHMERIERLHRQKLSVQAGNVRTNFPVSSVKWYS